MQTFGRAVALAAVLGLATVTGLAAQHAGMSGHGQGAMPGMQGMMEEMQGMMHEMLGVHAFNPASLLERKTDLALSDDQVRKLDALAREVKTAKDHAKAEHQTRHARIVEQFKLARPDPSKVKVDGQEAMQDMAAAHGITLSAAARAKGLLTDTQRSQVAEWISEHEKGMHQGAGPGMKKENGGHTNH